ncbi:MAG TPA: hypothetical protein VNO33_09275 [Kofleriaceae bacterium]|nr:hypothetical protein [Kofleriaceae bacterium]
MVVVDAGALDVSGTFVGHVDKVGHVIEAVDNGGAQVQGAGIDHDQVNVNGPSKFRTLGQSM